MARNVTGGSGGKRWAVDITNLREVQARFREIANEISGISGIRSNKTADNILNQQFTAISEYLRDRIRASAVAKGAPKRVQDAVFAFSDPNAPKRGNRNRRSALVGVRKGAPPRRDNRLYVEWRGTGKTIGMSLATLFEKGSRDRRIRPLRYFSAACFSSKTIVLNRLTAAYKKAIESLNPR